MKLFAPSVTDGYKVGHGEMYAEGTEIVYSNLTPRSNKIYLRNCTKFYDGKLVVVGVQGAVQEVKEMWDAFFDMEKSVAVKRFARRMAGYLGGEVEATKQLAALHDLGYLPLKIKSLPEGSKVAMGIPVMTIRNTKKEFFWLVNYLESVLSDLIWKPATNATIAAEYKAICKHYAKLTGTDDFTVSIQCHDFSMRGMSGPEDAARSGFAHLTSFIGTDTLPAIDYAEDYYDADPDSLIAISVRATEHAVATSNILGIERGIVKRLEQNECRADALDTRLEAEKEFLVDLIARKFPNGIISYVTDSFDYWGVVTKILPELNDVVMGREACGLAPGKLVIRPDSGDPVKVVCGYKEEEYRRTRDGVAYPLEAWNGVVFVGGVDPITEHEIKGSVEVLWETFGGTVTDKGYKMLDSHIGLIYGDSITTKRAAEILQRLMEKGFASGNIMFGVGSYTYQCNTRDTFGFAVKATYTEVSGQPLEVFKDPKTDAKKKSDRGMLRVEKDEVTGEFYRMDQQPAGLKGEGGGYLETIFEDGEFVKRTTLAEIRERLAA